MIKNYFLNDLNRNKLTSLSIMIFVMIATLLLTSAVLLFTQLSKAVEGLMTQAQAPHFMQMHKGDIDNQVLADFVHQNADVNKYQIASFVNVPNEKIYVNGISLKKSVQDIGLVKQNEAFDYLLDNQNRIIQPSRGEIYVPYYYIKNKEINIGDQIKIYNQTFVVTDYHRDAIMNSSLASSKRFLVSNEDFNRIEPFGGTEYLIEFRLSSVDQIKAFETKYAGLSNVHNGPTLTYDLFYLLNSLSNGLMIVVLFTLSVAVILISFLCIRFTLLAKLEEDGKEIGVLKTLGIPNKVIEKLYISKYLVITCLGISLGYLLTIVLKQKILLNILSDFGAVHTGVKDWLWCLVVPLFIGLVVSGFSILTIRKVRTMHTIEAIREQTIKGKSSLAKRLKLYRLKQLGTLDFVSLKTLLVDKKIYGTLILLMSISFLMMTLPTSLFTTIASEDFVTYMGVGKSDFRIDLQHNTLGHQLTNEIVKKLESDKAIDRYVVLDTKAYLMHSKSSQNNVIKIELGDHSIFPIHYSIGHMPEQENEIAFSIISKDAFGLNLGDIVQIQMNGNEEDFVVCGFYSDITNGGKTAKANFKDNQSKVIWSVIYADLFHKASKVETIKAYQDDFPTCRVSDIKFFVNDTFGQMLMAIKRVATLGVIVATLLIYMITVLLVRLIILRDKSELVALKTIGFSFKNIKFQMMKKIGLCILIAFACSYGFHLILGQRLIGLILEGFGVSAFEMKSNMILSGLLYPILFFIAIECGVLVSIRPIKSWTVLDGIKE